MNHTPTPWKIEKEKETIGHETFAIKSSKELVTRWAFKEDAAFIVTACNAHEDLVRALKDIADMSTFDDAVKVAERALAKAGIKQ